MNPQNRQYSTERTIAHPPPLLRRIFNVWYRHMRVYSRSLFTNSLPPFLEPTLFIVGIGFGLGFYIEKIEVAGTSYPFIAFLASGIMITSAVFTSAFECSFATFIRLTFDKVYDGMLGAPITIYNLLIGEIVWAGTKGFIFTAAVTLVTGIIGVIPWENMILIPFLGFATGLMFASLGFVVTSMVKVINQFNFFFSGFISPLFFISGVVFPIENLPSFLRPISELSPITHPVRLTRAITLDIPNPLWWWDILYIIVFVGLIGTLGVLRLKRKIIN